MLNSDFHVLAERALASWADQRLGNLPQGDQKPLVVKPRMEDPQPQVSLA